MKRFLYTLLLLCAGSLYVIAGTTGKLSGRVVDATKGEPIVGANVVIVGTSLGASSDPEGYFSIINITPGVYEIRASGVGYQSVKMENVSIGIDKTTKVNVTMPEAAVSLDAIEVIATRESVV